MIAWFLTVWAWFSKLSWVVKIMGFIAEIKQYWYFIVIGLLVVYIGILHFLLLVAENRYLECENKLKSMEAINASQNARIEYIDRIVEKKVVEYKDRVKIIKEYAIDENKTVCDNAMSIIRLYF